MTSLDADAAVHNDDYDNVDDELPRPPRPPPMPTASEVLACQFSSWYHAFRDMDHHHHNDDDDDDASVVDDDARWRMRRKRRRNATIESTIIRPLPSEFVDYLLSDGVRLPSCATKVSSCMNDDADVDRDDGRWDESNDDDDDDDEDEDDGDCSSSGGGYGAVGVVDGDGGDGGIVDDDDDDDRRHHAFPDLTAKVQSALDLYSSSSPGGGGGCFPKLNWSAPRDASWINCGTLQCRKAGDMYLLLKSSDFMTSDLEMAWVGGLCVMC